MTTTNVCRMVYSYRPGPEVSWVEVANATGVPADDVDIERESALHQLDLMAADRLTLTPTNTLALVRMTVFDAAGRVIDSSAVPVVDDSNRYELWLWVLAEGDAANLAEIEVRPTEVRDSVPWRLIGRYPAAAAVLRAFADVDLVEPGHLFGRVTLVSPDDVELLDESVVLANPTDCVTVAQRVFAAREAHRGQK